MSVLMSMKCRVYENTCSVNICCRRETAKNSFKEAMSQHCMCRRSSHANIVESVASATSLTALKRGMSFSETIPCDYTAMSRDKQPESLLDMRCI